MRLIDADAEIKKIEEEIKRSSKPLTAGDQEECLAAVYMT